MKIFISTSTFGKYDKTPLNILKTYNFDYSLNPHGRTLKSNEIIPLVNRSIGLIAGTEELNKKILENLPNLKVISRCGAGIENIDLATSKKLGIKIFNTPTPPTIAVAELVISLILSSLRHLHLQNSEMHQKIWKKRMGNLLTGKTIGIIGFGKIGMKVAYLLEPFKAKILYFDPYTKKSINQKQFKSDTLESIFKNADIISIHVPKNEETTHYIGKKRIISNEKNLLFSFIALGEGWLMRALYMRH